MPRNKQYQRLRTITVKKHGVNHTVLISMMHCNNEPWFGADVAVLSSILVRDCRTRNDDDDNYDSMN